MKHILLIFLLSSFAYQVSAEDRKRSAEEEHVTSKCFAKGDCEAAQAYFTKMKEPSVASFYAKTGCEDFKKAKDCLAYASYMGNRGFDDIGIGYLKTACKIDPKTCPAIDLIKCLMKAKNDGKRPADADEICSEHRYGFTEGR